MKSLGVAVWGLGPHAIRNIIPAILGCPGLTLYGLCSRNLETVRRSSHELNCRSWETPDAMLADSAVDVVYLATPIGLHAPQGKSVLLAGKHLWCEKPLAEDLAKVDALVGISREAGLSITEGFMYLYHPQFIALSALLSSGGIGKVRSIHCRFGIPPLERPGFRLNPELGGGAFLDVGCYPVSAAAALYPDTQAEILLSEIVTRAGASVDSSGRAVLRYPDGARVTLEWGIDCGYRNEIDIWGSTGSARAELFFSKPADHVPTICLRDLRGSQSSHSVSPGNHFVAMLRAFHHAATASAAAEQERERISHRARLMERIRVTRT